MATDTKQEEVAEDQVSVCKAAALGDLEAVRKAVEESTRLVNTPDEQVSLHAANETVKSL